MPTFIAKGRLPFFCDKTAYVGSVEQWLDTKDQQLVGVYGRVTLSIVITFEDVNTQKSRKVGH